jgi:hypothetical protein
MTKLTDKLDTCPKCNCDGCYISPINETKYSYSCFGCGFYSSDLLIDGEYDRPEYESELPELYKDLVYTDANNRNWYPQTITIDSGTVFINGSKEDSWQWSAIKTIDLTEEEMKMPRFLGKNKKSDPKSIKGFGKDFLEALDYIGVFDKKD